MCSICGLDGMQAMMDLADTRKRRADAAPGGKQFP